MKKQIALLLALTLVLTGCTAAKPTLQETVPAPAETQTPATTVPHNATIPTVADETEAPQTTTAPVPQIESTQPALEEAATEPTQETESTQPAPEKETAPPEQEQEVPQPTPEKENTPPAPEKETAPPTPVVDIAPSTPTPEQPSQNYPEATKNDILMFARNAKTIFVGDTDSLEVFYFGNKKLSWYSSHPLGLIVDQEGNISPIYEGNYTVYVTDGEYTAYAEIFAPKDWGGASGIYFDSLQKELTTGQSALLSLEGVSPGGLVSFSSSDTSVVRVSGSYITAVSPGTAIVTAQYYTQNANMIVTVVPNSNTVSLQIKEESIAIYDADEVHLNWSYTGSGTLEWSSSNSYVARVDENGLVTAVGKGSCSIYLSDGTYADQCEITVSIEPNVKAESLNFISLNGPLYDGVTKFKGNYVEFIISVYPHNADSDICVSVSDPKVIGITWERRAGDDLYRLDFKKAGTCVVDIASADGAVKHSYTVHVQDTYACDPGKNLLTPGEFAYYATQVGVENGQSASYTLSGYLYLWLSDDELTWERAKELGESVARNNYRLDNEHILIFYAGWDEEAGKHLFYHGY